MREATTQVQRRGIALGQQPQEVQRRGIALGQQPQEVHAEAGDEMVRPYGYVTTNIAPGNTRLDGSTSPLRAKQSPPFRSLFSPKEISKDAFRRRTQYRVRLKGLKMGDSPIKFASLGAHHGRVPVSWPLAWNIKYTRLLEDYEQDVDEALSPKRPSLSIAEGPMKDPWAQEIAMAAAMDMKKFIRAWANLSPGKKNITWPIVIFWALRHFPERALSVLHETILYPDYRPPPFAVADSLDYLACVFLRDRQQPARTFVRRIFRMVCIVLEQSKGQTANFNAVTQRTMYLLVRHCDDRQKIRIYELMRECQAFMHTNTLLHLMTSFIDMGRLATAMEILQRIANSEGDLKSDRIRSVCAKLLHAALECEDSYRIRSNMLAQMLKLGISPSLMMYNVILQNAVEAGQTKVAWSIYRMVRASKFEPDAYTYSILLNGMKHRMDEVQVSKLLQRAKEDGILARSPYLAAQLLHAIYLRRSTHEDFPVFTEMVPSYEQYFDAQPLKDLRLLQDSTITSPQSHAELMKPPPPALGIMISVYLLQHRESDHIPALYARYRELVEAGHPLIAPIAETDHTSNAFLMALGRRLETLPLCTTILEQMLKPPTSKAIRHAEPTVQTWSILLAAFMRHGQATAAEKVLAMMRDRGMEPNQVTWNTLISGYAGMQNIEGTIDVMRRMEREGYEVEERTMEAWGRVVDRKRLMQAFNRAVKEEEQAYAEQGHGDPEHD